MKKLAFVAAVLGFVACSKADQNAPTSPKEPASSAPAAPPATAKAPAAVPAEAKPKTTIGAASDPANLPPAGDAPASVTVDKQLDSMWSAPIHTLKGEPTTLAAYKGKALLLVNVA